MKTKENASIATLMLKIIAIAILIMFGFTLAVNGDNLQLSTVKVRFSNDSEINVLTSKTKVSEILEENHILLLEDEKVTPSLDDNIGENMLIVISNVDEKEIELSTEVDEINIETLTNNYSAITEKIITVTEEIPYETIEKDISNNAESTTNKVLQNGINGIREVTYRVKSRGDVELEKEEISSKVIKEPVDKIVQVISRQTTSRSNVTRTGTNLADQVEGLTPKVSSMNISAYTASTCDKAPTDKGYGITASGSAATEWCTVAAGKGYAIGTIIYIPYFKEQPNGGWFVVQDRGGAISNSRIDVYMGTYSECIQFGRRNLECYIYEV